MNRTAFPLTIGTVLAFVSASAAGWAAKPVTDSPDLQFQAGSGIANVQLLQDDIPLLHSPRDGLWAIAMDFQDGWPTKWYHGAPQQVEHVAEWTILRGKIPTPQGDWEVSDAYRPEQGTVKCVRRFVWKGKEDAQRCTLSVRFTAPGAGDDVVMPGILYHGNPSGRGADGSRCMRDNRVKKRSMKNTASPCRMSVSSGSRKIKGSARRCTVSPARHRMQIARTSGGRSAA